MSVRDILGANAELVGACFERFVALEKCPFECKLVCLEQGLGKKKFSFAR